MQRGYGVMRSSLYRLSTLRVIGLGLIASVVLGCGASKTQLQGPEHYRFAQSYLGTGSYTLAEQEIRKALALQPQDPQYLGFLALIYQAQGRYAPAEDAYRLAVQQPEVPPAVLVNYSTLLLLRNREDEAIALTQRALQSPGYDKPAFAYTNLGLAYLQKGLLAQALIHFQKALEYQTDLPQVYHNLGLVYDRLGQPAEAIRSFREATRYQPSYVEAYHGLGKALLEGRQYAEATEAFREAIRLRSSYIEAYHGLVKALLASGRKEEARVAFERVVALDPHSQAVADLRTQLKLLTP